MPWFITLLSSPNHYTPTFHLHLLYFSSHKNTESMREEPALSAHCHISKGAGHITYYLFVVRWRHVQVFALVLSLSSPLPPLDFRLSTCKKTVWVQLQDPVLWNLYRPNLRCLSPNPRTKWLEEIDNSSPFLTLIWEWNVEKYPCLFWTWVSLNWGD